MTLLKRFQNRYGRVVGVVRFFAYPLILLATMPVRLVQTLYNCRVLANGKWSNYGPQFNPSYGINNLFYSTVTVNFDRYGRTGVSPQLGTGNFRMNMLYAYCLPSLYAQWRMGPMVPFLGMFGWLAAHTVWLLEGEPVWRLAVIGLTAVSSLFYVNCFGRQNYHALGWMFFPLGLYFVSKGAWGLAAVAWLAVSLSSPLAILMALALMCFLGLWTLSLAPLASLVPALVKLSLHLLPSIRDCGLVKTLEPIIKIMGARHRNSKYARLPKGQYLQLPLDEILYHLLLHAQFMVAVFAITGQVPVLLLAGLLIFLANATIFRIHDIQTVHMALGSVGVMIMLAHPDPWLLPFFWLFISPLPNYLNMPGPERNLDVMPVCAPYDLKSSLEAMESFMAPVKTGQRVLMCFEDPKGRASNIFDGYRFSYELPLYVAAQKSVHLMPDWWAVIENNYEGAPDFWGRDLTSVLDNVRKWNPAFVIVYQDPGTELNGQWEESGFRVAETFHWNEHPQLNRDWLVIKPLPDWWLLRVPDEAWAEGEA